MAVNMVPWFDTWEFGTKHHTNAEASNSAKIRDELSDLKQRMLTYRSPKLEWSLYELRIFLRLVEKKSSSALIRNPPFKATVCKSIVAVVS